MDRTTLSSGPSLTCKIQLQVIKPEELPTFIADLRSSFSVAVQREFGISEPLPPVEDIEASYRDPQCTTYHVVADGEIVGGAVVKIDPVTWHNALELFFIKVGSTGHGLGLAAWQAIEARYPQTRVWTTVTPYFEQRNIHFYVNKCGFHIVEFFCAHHQDPQAQPAQLSDGTPDPGEESYFLFEKIMPVQA